MQLVWVQSVAPQRPLSGVIPARVTQGRMAICPFLSDCGARDSCLAAERSPGPSVRRGEQGPSDRPLSLAVHCMERDAFIFALCQDHKLRMWSYKVGTAAAPALQVGLRGAG